MTSDINQVKKEYLEAEMQEQENARTRAVQLRKILNIASIALLLIWIVSFAAVPLLGANQMVGIYGNLALFMSLIISEVWRRRNVRTLGGLDDEVTLLKFELAAEKASEDDNDNSQWRPSELRHREANYLG